MTITPALSIGVLAAGTHRPGRMIGAMLTFFLGLVWFLREIYVATVSAHRRSLSRSALIFGDCGRLPFGTFTEYLTLYENSLDSLSAVCYATGRMPLATLNARSQRLERLELSFSVKLPEVYNE